MRSEVTAPAAVVVVHDMVSTPARRLVQVWTERAYPGAVVQSLREDWSATSFDDEALIVPVRHLTDPIGLAHVVPDVPATVGAFRQLFHLGNDGGSLEEFLARTVRMTTGTAPDDD